MNWIIQHWELLSLLLWLAINILNAASRHWSNQEGVMRWITFATEVLSIIRSRDQAPGTIMGNAKLPFDLPRSGARVLIPFALVACAGLSGCCGTARCYLARAQTALEAADQIAVTAMEKACAPRVATCTGKIDDCAEYKECVNTTVVYRSARNVTGTALAELNAVLEQMGVP